MPFHIYIRISSHFAICFCFFMYAFAKNELNIWAWEKCRYENYTEKNWKCLLVYMWYEYSLCLKHNQTGCHRFLCQPNPDLTVAYIFKTHSTVRLLDTQNAEWISVTERKWQLPLNSKWLSQFEESEQN